MTTLQGLRREALYSDGFRERLHASPVRGVIAEPWAASSAADRVDRMLDVDTATYLPDDLLTKVDIATMAYSLEGRSPLLDHEFMEFAAVASRAAEGPRRQRRRSGFKRALRGWVPDEILDRPQAGLPAAAGEVVSRRPAGVRARRAARPPGDERGYFRPARVRALLDDHADGRADNAQGIWTLLMFELWHREQVDQRARLDSAVRPA